MKTTRYKLILITAALAAVILLPAFLFSGCRKEFSPALFTDTLEGVVPDADTHVRAASAGEPVIIYAPPEDVSGYRYGPSIMYYADGSADAWFSTNGYAGEWDWLTVKHSDSGFDFGGERVMLVPTPDSYDKFSCCDPGVIYSGGYYYCAYTSTIVSTNGGVNNNVFVARSKRPDGPFEKWTGSGWGGGDPVPIVYYDEHDLKYGAGEPSIVEVNDTLYVYYTWACPDGNFTKLSTAPAGANWPAELVDRGIVYEKNAQDSLDVAYLEDAGKFVAFATQNRFSENSGIAVLESEDGTAFYQTDFFATGLYQYCHNMGISRRPDGHIKLSDKLYIGYAFSNGESGNWGKWATAFQPVSLELYKGPVDEPDPSEKGILCDNYFWDREKLSRTIGISPTERIIEMYSEEDRRAVTICRLDSALAAEAVENPKKLRFYGYDKSLVNFRGAMAYTKGKTGETTVKVSYGGFETEFRLYVRKNFSEFQGAFTKTVEEFTPVCDRFELSAADQHFRQIRGLARFSDNTWAEVYNEGKMVDAKRFPVTYETADESVAVVNERGIIFPVSQGETTVKVTICGEKSFTVTVVVTGSAPDSVHP